MKRNCPNPNCLFYHKDDHIIKDGTYYRQDDSRHIKRYKCKHCGKKFSSATFSLACYQKKRRINFELNALLAAGLSMRRTAKILHVHRITVKRKQVYLARKNESVLSKSA